MQSLRALILRYRLVAAMILGAAIVVRAMLPAGFMPDMGSRTIRVVICMESQGLQAVAEIAVPSRTDSQHGPRAGHEECAFASQMAPAMAGADILLLALALAFILLIGLASEPLRLFGHKRGLRPPLRGPPALI